MRLVLPGILIARSRCLPALTGVLVVLAGIVCVVNSALNLLYPTLSLYPYILAPALPGEGGLTLWLLIAGSNARRFEERSALA